MAVKSVTYVFAGREVQVTIGCQLMGKRVAGIEGNMNAQTGTGFARIIFENKCVLIVCGVPFLVMIEPDVIMPVQGQLVVPGKPERTN